MEHKNENRSPGTGKRKRSAAYADCFARVRGKRRECAALEVMHCEGCPFYKSSARMAGEADECERRLRGMARGPEARAEHELHLQYLSKVR